MTDKVIRDGKVAVIVSRGYGAGWSTWARDAHAEWCLHAPELVEALEAGDIDKFRALAEARGEGIYLGGASKKQLDIEWVPQGQPFYVHEYDGSEWVVTDFHIA